MHSVGLRHIVCVCVCVCVCVSKRSARPALRTQRVVQISCVWCVCVCVCVCVCRSQRRFNKTQGLGNLSLARTRKLFFWHTATHCNSLQLTATHCNTTLGSRFWDLKKCSIVCVLYVCIHRQLCTLKKCSMCARIDNRASTRAHLDNRALSYRQSYRQSTEFTLQKTW